MEHEGFDDSSCSSLSPVSNSTKELIKTLMKEQNVRGKLKKELLECVDVGESFPYVPKNCIVHGSHNEIEIKPPKTQTLPLRPMQRTKSTIEELGAYIREQFRPTPSKTRPPKEKERLQNRMAFGKDIDPELTDYIIKQATVPSEKNITVVDQFNEILTEIEERRDFLNDMIALGQGKKYFSEIKYETSQRLKELEKLDRDRARTIIVEYGM